MRKFLSLLSAAALLCALLVGCGNQPDPPLAQDATAPSATDPVYNYDPVDGDALVFTPQELIDQLNDIAAQSYVEPIPDYTESGDSLNVGLLGCATFFEADDGRCNKVQLYFLDSNQAMLVGGVYIGGLLGGLLGDDADPIAAQCNAIVRDRLGVYNTTAQGMDIHFHYSDDGEFFELKVPAAECGDQPDPAPAQDNPPSEPSVSEDLPEQSDVDICFRGNAASLIKNLKNLYAQTGIESEPYPEPDIGSVDEFGNAGPCKTYTYGFPSYTLVIYESAATSCVAGIFITIDGDSASSEAQFTAWGRAATALLALSGVDESFRVDQLYADAMEMGSSFSSSEYAEYTMLYSDEGGVSLLINLKT